jgi:hypothetical protein
VINPHDLIGVEEIALQANVTSSAVVNWRRRFPDFPIAVAELASGPVFNAPDVAAWLDKREGGGEPKRATCFVIGPIGSELAPIGHRDRLVWEQSIETWAKLIEPACVAAGLQPIRADQITKAGEITDQVFALIRDVDILIADVTGGNPNVLYELGLRHTLPKATIQIGEYGQLPFDIAAIRTLQFSRTPSGLVDGRKQLEAAIATALAGEFDSVTATRLWRSSASGALFSPKTDQTEPEIEVDNPGTFELLAAMETAFPELNELTERRTATMMRIAALTQDATAEVHQGDAANKGFAGRLMLANKLAGQLASVADDLEEIATAYEDRVSRIDAGMTCLLDSVDEDPSQLKDMGTFAQSIKTFVLAIREADAKQAEFVSAMIAAGRFSKPLRIATRRIADATKRCSNVLALAEVWNARLEQLIDRLDRGVEGARTS